jgi:hypothetical protein
LNAVSDSQRLREACNFARLRDTLPDKYKVRVGVLIKDRCCSAKQADVILHRVQARDMTNKPKLRVDI